MSESTQQSSLRIASLLPSATEIVCALGARESIVGVSHECDWPAGVDTFPHLTRSRLSANINSASIDRDIRSLIEQALSIYELDSEKMARLEPCVVITQDLCDVCAVSFDIVERACQTLLPNAQIVNLRPNTWPQVLQTIGQVGAALDRQAQAEAVVDSLRSRCDAITARAKSRERRPRVLSLEWLEPWMVGGSWMPELIEAAGGQALVTKPGDHSPTLTDAELAALQPDVVMVKPCGFDLETVIAESQKLSERLAQFKWPALDTNSVWLTDGNAFFNRPGPRLVESLEILAACMHPLEFGDFALKHAKHRFRLESIR